MSGAAKSARLGSFVSRTAAGEAYKAFMPPALPPKPSLDMARLYKPLERAMQALGVLNTVAELLPEESPNSSEAEATERMAW